jgi:hypothetical protein
MSEREFFVWFGISILFMSMFSWIASFIPNPDAIYYALGCLSVLIATKVIE